MENLEKELLANLDQHLIDYLENYHFLDDDRPDAEQALKEDWIDYFDAMAKKYPNLFKDFKEDAPEQWELERKTILRWANG